MSEESDPPEPKFSQIHYDRLIEGHKPWLEFRGAWMGEGDAWEAFEKDSPTEVATIRKAIKNWNTNARPTPALLDRAELNYMYLHGAHLESAHLVLLHADE